MAKVAARISVDVDVKTQDRGDHWSGFIKNIGTTVYADNEAAVLRRASDMVYFVIESFRKHSDLVTFRQYLTGHKIEHDIVIVPGSESKGNGKQDVGLQTKESPVIQVKAIGKELHSIRYRSGGALEYAA